tara:strand:+ start:4603 stop:4905 length:303 start_codon:yes stop_codon:yes gene_type:complete
MSNNHYQNGKNKKEKKGRNNRPKDNQEHSRVKGLYEQRGSEDILNEDGLPTARVYDGSIEPPDKEMPFELWLKVIEHQSFVEELRIWLGSSNITLGNEPK